MKFFIRFLCVTILLSFLVGCSACTSSQSSVSEMMANLPQSQDIELPDAVLFSTDDYTLHRTNGRCYVSLAAGNVAIDNYNGGCVIPPNSICFSSIDELYSFLNKDIPSASLTIIQGAFPLQEEYGFLTADPEKLYSMEVDSNYQILSLELSGDKCTYHYRSSKRGDINSQRNGTVTIKSEEAFVEDLTFFDRFQSGSHSYDSSFDVPTINGKAYDCTVPAGLFRYVQYCVKTDTRTLYIEERYAIERVNYDLPTSETEPIEIMIYGCENGAYFSLLIGDFNRDSMMQWLKSFHIEPYTP